jgi:presenilin-like A22 family membrane protease
VLVFDLILSLGLAGVAVAVGVGFRPIAMTAVLAALSVYDIIAVYLTRHMVLMGRALLRRKVFFAMILPERPAGLLAKMGQVAPGKEFLFLGTGDFVLPALLTVSVAAYYGTAASLFVAVGAAVGLAATHIIFISKSKMRPMAALPPIAAGSVIGYVLSLLMM